MSFIAHSIQPVSMITKLLHFSLRIDKKHIRPND